MFNLKIETDNAAFDHDNGGAEQEVARLLRLTADAVEAGTSGAPLFDYNGNKVGRFDLKLGRG